MVQFDGAAVPDRQVGNLDQRTLALQRLLQQSGAKTKNVALALPATAVITKIIRLAPEPDPLLFEYQVETEAAQYLPFPLHEASLDYQVIGPRTDKSDEIEVFVAATRREMVQEIQDLAQAAGLHPVILDVDAQASCLSIQRVIDEKYGRHNARTVALFELGSHTTRMQIIRDGAVLYDRDQSLGGARLTQLIAERYSCSLADAELKKRHSNLPPDYGATVLRPFVEHLAFEINRALAFFFANTAYGKVDVLMLAGGSASLPGLPESVAAVAQCHCVLVNPFEGMMMGEGDPMGRMAAQAPAFLIACGLALRRFPPWY